MSKKTQIIIIILVALIFFGLGYTYSATKNRTSANNYKAGWEAARARLIENGFIRENMEMSRVFGEIKEINGDKMTLKIRPVDPLADQFLDTRIIIVDQNTKVYRAEIKNPKEYAAEIDAYNKLPKDKRPADLPSSFKKTEISLADLQVGQTIEVRADKNIKDMKEFKVIEINYTQLASSPAASVK